jgi:hypothetical protein
VALWKGKERKKPSCFVNQLFAIIKVDASPLIHASFICLDTRDPTPMIYAANGSLVVGRVLLEERSCIVHSVAANLF